MLSNYMNDMFMQPFHRLRRSAGVDRAVFYSILSRAFSTAGSLFTIPLILTRLTPAEQGFYYTFGSIVALQIFLEMGFGQVAVQMVAHEAAHLKLDLRDGVTGPVSNMDRFAATIRFVRNWYAVVSILVAVFLMPVGIWFFYTSANSSSTSWFWPWVIMVFSAAGGVFVRSMASMVEGMGFVAESIRVNLWGGAVQIFLTIVCLFLGLRLYSVPVASAVALGVNSLLVWPLLRSLTNGLGKYGNDIRIDWVKEIFPYQWRIAVSWMSGWFIFNAMMPVVFRQLGPEEAGRFGLAMSVAGFISALALNWTSTKSAIWGQMASRKEWPAMDALFWRVTPLAVGVSAVASILAILVVPHLGVWIPRFAGRVPEWRVLLMLCFAAVINQVVYAEAFYLRAHKREPLLANSVFIGVSMAIGLFAVKNHSAFSVSVMYAALSVLGVMWGSIVFVYCRFYWHQRSIPGNDSFSYELKQGIYGK